MFYGRFTSKNTYFDLKKVKENQHFSATFEIGRGLYLDIDENGFYGSQIGRRNENQLLVSQKINIPAHSIRD